MNKMFTSVGVLQLVQKGKMSLDGTIADYWPDYPNQEIARKVKVRHLLSHTGGTGDIFGPEFDAHRTELKTLADYAKLYGTRGPKFEPGSRFEYSNYGFLLLGLLVEKVSGRSYYDYVRENIFVPAGMKSTDSLPESEAVLRRATGYMKEKGDWKPNTDTLPWRGTSAGGGYSTVRDLLRFAEALQSGKLISRELLAEATRDQTPEQGRIRIRLRSSVRRVIRPRRWCSRNERRPPHLPQDRVCGRRAEQPRSAGGGQNRRFFPCASAAHLSNRHFLCGARCTTRTCTVFLPNRFASA